MHIYSQSNYSMKCKLSTYVVKHSLTTLKYNNISQVCPYKDLGSAKDYIIILLFLMQPSAGDKPDRMQSQEKSIIITTYPMHKRYSS